MSGRLELEKTSLGAIPIITAAILMGSLAIFVRNVPLHPVQVVFFRTLIGFIFLSIPVIASRKIPVIRNPRVLVAIILVNLVVITTYISAIQLIEMGTAALLLYMAPLYVLPAAHIMGGKVGKTAWFALPVGIAGLYLMLTPYGELSFGLGLGLVSGISYAAIFFLTKTARVGMSSLHMTFIVLGTLALLTSPSIFLLPLNNVNIYWLLGLGLFPTAIAFTLFYYGIKFCKVEQAPLFALVEPVAAAILGYTYFGEVLIGKQIIGGALILISVAIAWKKVEK